MSKPYLSWRLGLAFERKADAPSYCKQKWKEAVKGLELSRELAKQVHFRGSAFKDEIPAASKTINLYASVRCVDPSPSVGSSHKSSQMMPLPLNCTLNGHQPFRKIDSDHPTPPQ